MTGALMDAVPYGPAPQRNPWRGIVAPLLLLTVWQGLSTCQVIDPRLLPPLQQVALTAWAQTLNGSLLDDIGVSLARDLSGFVVGSAAGFGFGLLLGLSPLARATLRPSFDALKSIALFAWIPLIAMWFGFGETSKIAFIALAAFTPVAMNTEEGVRHAPCSLLEVASALFFTPWQRLRLVYIPAAMPSVLTGLQLGLIYAWLATVGAEYFLSGGRGVGGILIEGRDRFDMAQVLLGVILLGGIGFLLNRVTVLVDARLLRWRRT